MTDKKINDRETIVGHWLGKIEDYLDDGLPECYENKWSSAMFDLFADLPWSVPALKIAAEDVQKHPEFEDIHNRLLQASDNTVNLKEQFELLERWLA